MNDLTAFVVYGVLLNGIGAAGLLGNALAVLVLSRPRMRSSINCLLIGLVVSDSALILNFLLLYGLNSLSAYNEIFDKDSHYIEWFDDYYLFIFPCLVPYAYPLAMVSQTMSVYLTLLVTLERWVAVCHPLRAVSLCTWARARWGVLATTLFAFLYNIPRFFEFHVDDEYEVNETSLRSDMYLLVYNNWMYRIVMYVVPLVLLAVLNACILQEMRRARQKREQLTTQRRHELGLANMLLVAVLVFFVCNSLGLAVSSYDNLLFDFPDFDPLEVTSNLLVVVNSSVNFIIYVVLGKRFKREFLSMFGMSCVRVPPASKPPPPSSRSTGTDPKLCL